VVRDDDGRDAVSANLDINHVVLLEAAVRQHQADRPHLPFAGEAGGKTDAFGLPVRNHRPARHETGLVPIAEKP